MKALIIEDEIVAAKALETLLKEIVPKIQILGILQTIDESIEWFQEHERPDLVFMDIHLADGSSFAIFEEVNIACPIIFTTAYDEYALKAFEVNSIDYLLKPINKKDMERALAKYENFSFHPDEGDLLRKILVDIKQEKQQKKTHFLIPEKDKLIPVEVKNLACIYIDTKIVKAITFDHKVYYLEANLDELMQQLDPELFYRANRQYIISKKAIKDITLWFGNKLSVNLNVDVPQRILVSKARVGEFKKWVVSSNQ
ncbi:MAG: LytTR family DNA-binding domain-containing protein [Bacteroidales bacterium]|nr:LytTR family DNA-binding domain-containing protein [Bacteroidales bacterium]